MSWNVVALGATLGMGLWGCTAKSDNGSGTGGDSGSTASGGASGSGTGGAAGSNGVVACTRQTSPTAVADASSDNKKPCDIYGNDGGRCVAAHSMIRALYAGYSGPLYQVRKMSDGSTMDINADGPGGMAKSEDQESFCGVEACTVSIIYDQSGFGNHLTKGPAGMANPTPNSEANAKSIPITIGGKSYYGIHIVPGIGYRNNTPCGTATGDDPETEYMIVAGDFYNGGCCFDYGNMETTSRDDGEGTMEAVYFGTCTIWGKGDAAGPWVMGDLENGLWAGNFSPFTDNKVVTSKYVTGMVKGDKAGMNHWTIKVGDATSGPLTTPFDGERPSSRYNPMRKQGAVGLGTGGDASNAARGNWFEGLMTDHYASEAADNAVQANIVSVYGQM